MGSSRMSENAYGMDSDLPLGPMGSGHHGGPNDGPGLEPWSPFSNHVGPNGHPPHLGGPMPGGPMGPNMSPGSMPHPFLGRHSPGVPMGHPQLMPLDSMSGIPRLMPPNDESGPPGYMDYPPPSGQNHVEVY